MIGILPPEVTNGNISSVGELSSSTQPHASSFTPPPEITQLSSNFKSDPQKEMTFNGEEDIGKNSNDSNSNSNNSHQGSGTSGKISDDDESNEEYDKRSK